jgi:hypothetical protein
MGTYLADTWASRMIADGIEADSSEIRWRGRIMSLLDEGEKAGQLEMVYRALLDGAAIVITHRSRDADRETLMAMRYLSEVCGLTQPGSLAN